MPHQASASSPNDALEEILQQLALLDRTQLLQLQEQLVELISLFPPPLTEISLTLQSKQEPPGKLVKHQAQYTTAQLPGELIKHQAQHAAPLHGSRGGGGIEWKLIRQGDKVYGPYPYWRFNIGKSRRSIYLKQLARSSRQGKTLDCQDDPTSSLKAAP